jgi:CBS-domain-containing membrane protein
MLEDAAVTAAELMSRDVAVVHPDTSLLQAVRLLAHRRISGVPVVDHTGALVGMLSEGDLVRWHQGFTEKQARWFDLLADGYDLAPDFLETIRSEQHKVKSVMSTSVKTVTEDTPAREVASILYDNAIKRVPVMRDGKMVGIVARSDLVRALAETLEKTSPNSG